MSTLKRFLLSLFIYLYQVSSECWLVSNLVPYYDKYTDTGRNIALDQIIEDYQNSNNGGEWGSSEQINQDYMVSSNFILSNVNRKNVYV